MLKSNPLVSGCYDENPWHRQLHNVVEKQVWWEEPTQVLMCCKQKHVISAESRVNIVLSHHLVINMTLLLCLLDV